MNSAFITQAFNLRSYSLAGLLASVSTLLFVRTIQRPTGRGWIAYALVMAAAMYAHFFSAFVAAAQVLSLLFIERDHIPLGNLVRSYAVTGVLIAPLAFFALGSDVGQVDWIKEPTVDKLAKALQELAGVTTGWTAVGYWSFALAIGGIGLWSLLRRGRSDRTWTTALVLLWLVLPIASAFLISYLKPLFVARYLMVALPALFLAAGAVVSALPRWGSGIAALALVAVALQGVNVLFDLPAHRGWEGKADHVLAASLPGDVVIFYAPTVIRPFGYYSGYYTQQHEGEDAPAPLYPPIDWLGFSRTSFDPHFKDLAERVGFQRRVWLVTGYARDRPRRREEDRMRRMLNDVCVLQEQEFGGTVQLFADCTPRAR